MDWAQSHRDDVSARSLMPAGPLLGGVWRVKLLQQSGLLWFSVSFAWASVAVSLVKAARSAPRSGSALTTASKDKLRRKGVKHGFLCLTPWRQAASLPWSLPVRPSIGRASAAAQSEVLDSG